MLKIYVDTSLSLGRCKVSEIFNTKLIMCWFSYCFVILLSKNYITAWYASLIIGETVYHPVKTGKWFFKKYYNAANAVL